MIRRFAPVAVLSHRAELFCFSGSLSGQIPEGLDKLLRMGRGHVYRCRCLKQNAVMLIGRWLRRICMRSGWHVVGLRSWVEGRA